MWTNWSFWTLSPSLPGPFAVSWQVRVRKTDPRRLPSPPLNLSRNPVPPCSGDALAPDGSAARTIRANCPALPRNLGGAVVVLLCTTMRRTMLDTLQCIPSQFRARLASPSLSLPLEIGVDDSNHDMAGPETEPHWSLTAAVEHGTVQTPRGTQDTFESPCLLQCGVGENDGLRSPLNVVEWVDPSQVAPRSVGRCLPSH
ncbi:hypothetical protein F5883DRAFT_677643 [Diaporthe sp. PMI_573]|nr:hypothetical protein F5883DRAFT_677643 [Diaporthaceae sp. PMI_573]